MFYNKPLLRPKSPKEAIAIQNSRSIEGCDIPLYDVDGETVIGVFHVYRQSTTHSLNSGHYFSHHPR